MKKMMLLIAAVLLAGLVTVACARAASPPPVTVTVPPGVVVPAPAAPPGGLGTIFGDISTPAPRPTPVPAPITVTAIAPAPSDASGLSEPPDLEHMIVRTGQLSLVVDDIPSAIDQITRLAESFKGYVVTSGSWREGERVHGTIAIRVPSGDFDSVMKSLVALAVEVTSQSTSGKDVTEEYVDLRARLKNLEATEQQLLQIMAKAEKVEDILNVQRELTATRGDIEQLKGRMQYLESLSTMSVIQISLEQSKLDVKFSASNGRVVDVGEVVRFAGQVAGGFTPYSYQWDFGDGSTSTDVRPGHVYKSVGSYTVSLKVTDNRDNTATETTKDYITVLAVPGWSAGSVAASAWNGLVTFGRVLADIFIWVGIFSPVWIIVGGIGYWWWRRRKKRA